MPMQKPILETWLERGLFASRWLMAPIYVGLVVVLGALMVVFFLELAARSARRADRQARGRDHAGPVAD
jgi:uncharacterized membrane protein YqhA